MNIRKATKEDREKILPLISRSSLYHKKEIEKEKIKNEKEFIVGIEEAFDKWIEQESKAYFIAKEGDRILGFILLMFDGVVSDKVSLSDLFVVPQKRKVGIAEKLIDHALESAKQVGSKNVMLTVHERNISALNLYRKVGFTDRQDNYVYMEKNLKSE